MQEILLQVQNTEPVAPRKLRPAIPADLETICLKCLQKDPVRRYQTAAALAADLNAFANGRPIRARPVSSAEKLWLWSRRHSLVAALTAGLCAAMVLGLAGVFWQWRRAEAAARKETILRQAAEDQAEQERLNLYAADVNLAAQAIHDHNFGRARHLLDGLVPKPGQADLRGFEWRYLWNRCKGAQLASLTGHNWVVTDLDFSPDGTRLASAGMDGTVRIWDYTTRQCLQVIETGTNSVQWASFTPDGRFLVVSSAADVELRNAASWTVERCFPAHLAALAREGDLMATSAALPFYFEAPGEIALWNWRTGQKLRTFAHPGHFLALSPDGRRLAVARAETGVDLYDTGSGALLRVLPTDNPVWRVCFSADGSRLLTSGWSSNALAWDLQTDAPPRVLAGHRRNIWSAVFSPDAKTIATTSSDQSVRLWDAATLTPLGVFRGHEGEVWCARFDPAGRTLATGGKDARVLLWPARAPPPPPAIASYPYAPPHFSPDGKQLLTVTPDGNRSQLWNAESRSLTLDHIGYNAWSVGFNQEGKIVIFNQQEMKLELWDSGSPAGAQIVKLQTDTTLRAYAKFGMSPDGGFLFAADTTGWIQIWDARSGGLTCAVQGPSPPLRNIVLGPGGRHLLVSASLENLAYLIDCQTRRQFHLAGHKDFVSGLAFSWDDSRAATSSLDGTIRLWQTASGQFLAALPGHPDEATDVAFSPDGRTLASIGQRESLKLWHLPTLREVCSENWPLVGEFLQFSPDGSRLAVTQENNQLALLPAD